MVITCYADRMSESLAPTDQRIRDAVRTVMDGSPKVTQTALAERMGITQPAVAGLVSGRRGLIPQSLINLLDALGLELVVQPKAK